MKMDEVFKGKCIRPSRKDEQKALMDYTNRRRIEKCEPVTVKTNEERKSENGQDFESLCVKIEECSVSKLPLLRKPVRSQSASTTTSTTTSCSNSNHVHKDVEAFQKFLEEHKGHYGGWKEKDHLFFIKTRSKYPLTKTAQIVNEAFPDISIEKVEEHDSWFKEYTGLKAANKKAIEEWKKTHKPPVKAKEEEKLEEKSQNIIVKRDPNIKQKIEIWRAHTLAAKIKRLEEYEKEEMRKKQEEEERKRLQAEKRALVNRYREEKLNYEMAMETAKETEKLQAKQDTMQRSLMLLKYFRYEDRRFTERQKALKEQKQQKKAPVVRKNVLDVKRDPNRLLQPTLGWTYHTKKTVESENTNPLYIQHVGKLRKPEWRKGVAT